MTPPDLALAEDLSLVPGAMEVPLRARDGSVRAYALVDAADFDWLNQWRWYLSHGYAVRKERGVGIRMHRVILGLERGDPRLGEHENRNKLDCRRSNLRIAEGEADNRQNLGIRADNKSGFRGVSWDKVWRKWTARASLAGRRYNLGNFDTPEEADAVVKAWRAAHMPFSEDARVA